MAENKQTESGLRVLFAAMRWPPETFIIRLIHGLLEKEVDITIACAQKPDKEWTSRKKFYWLPVPDTRIRLLTLAIPYFYNILRSFVASPRTFLMINRTFKKSQIKGFKWFTSLPFFGKNWDLIYFPWNSGAILFEQLLDLRIPSIISCRGSQVNIAPHNPERKEFNVGLQRTLRKASAVHCVSSNILEEAVRLGMMRNKGTIIRPAVDPHYFSISENRIDNQPLSIITTGSLIWLKGYEFALIALSQLIQSGTCVVFQIVGEGPEKQRILYTIQDLGLEKHVHLHGNLPPSQVRGLLQQADVFLLSSLSEGISNAVLEAMSCGLPVVTTDCGGMREAVTDGVEGFVVPVRNPKAMAEKLLLLARDPILRAQMGKNGRERIIRDFNLEKQINEFTDLFQSVHTRNTSTR